MARTLKNGKKEKYNKVSMFVGGNVTQADKRNKRATKKAERKFLKKYKLEDVKEART
jgi:hypothetical protein